MPSEGFGLEPSYVQGWAAKQVPRAWRFKVGPAFGRRFHRDMWPTDPKLWSVWMPEGIAASFWHSAKPWGGQRSHDVLLNVLSSSAMPKAWALRQPGNCQQGMRSRGAAFKRPLEGDVRAYARTEAAHVYEDACDGVEVRGCKFWSQQLPDGIRLIAFRGTNSLELLGSPVASPLVVGTS